MTTMQIIIAGAWLAFCATALGDKVTGIAMNRAKYVAWFVSIVGIAGGYYGLV